MKRTLTKSLTMLIITLAYQLISTSSFAQTPQKMSYQAVIRNLSNNLVTNKPIGMRISILQGSVSGATVYKEIYNPNPQTNANGLVTVEIGGGTAITGVFANINWANGPYFVKTETDPNGGTAYSITGVSQLLSVPYALHAKTADNGFSGNYEDLTNKPVIDGSETKVTAGINTNITGTGTTENPYVVNSAAHYIGEEFGGGIVFYVYDNGQHGLIVAKTDVAKDGIVIIEGWGTQDVTTNANSKGINGGYLNTQKMLSADVACGRAAFFVQKSNDGGFGDWYLPSIDELTLLFLQKNIIGGFADKNYWSSTEKDWMWAYYVNFVTGESTSGSKSDKNYARAIRSF